MEPGGAASAVSSLMIAIVAGLFTLLGVALKMIYDYLSERARNKRELIHHILPARREAYDAFIEAETRERAYVKRLNELYLRHLAGEVEMNQAEQDGFPPSALPDLIAAGNRIELVAGDYSVIQAAQNIIRLFADMTTALKGAMLTPSPDDGIIWFLLQRFEEDREREFVFAYRKDLGLGPPSGAPKDFPIRDRPWPLGDAESLVRHAISTKRHPNTPDQAG
jgi:hypothetical protein